jgi:phenylacetate-coenzyme A ligase PaaK-like adenylate-forming protein
MSIFNNKIKELLQINSYSFPKKKKSEFFLKIIELLNKYHSKNCKNYSLIIKKIPIFNSSSFEKLPTLPVRIFKDFEMKNSKSNIIKVMSSSGTSGKVSKIFLDKDNTQKQTLVLKKIFHDNFGEKRFPMLIVERKPSKDKIFNASYAAILGFSIFGKNHTYMLNEDGSINYSGINLFLKNNLNQKKFIFGFTSKIYEILLKNFDYSKILYHFKDSFILHGGGWKKLEKLKISNYKFKSLIKKKLNINEVYNYYGLVEQTGSIFFECKVGNHFHCSNFSEILIRDKHLQTVKKNQKGIVQLFSILPTSYPGHNILTEDIGIIKGEDDCSCGKKGKYFKILGRVKSAELRGCSDVV